MRHRADNNQLIVSSCIQHIMCIGNKAKLFQEPHPECVENTSQYCDFSVLLPIQADDLAS